MEKFEFIYSGYDRVYEANLVGEIYEVSWRDEEGIQKIKYEKERVINLIKKNRWIKIPSLNAEDF